jgi:hypothetical protein
VTVEQLNILKKILGKFQKDVGIIVWGVDETGAPQKILVKPDGTLNIANPPNLDVALSTRASETTLVAIKALTNALESIGSDTLLTKLQDIDMLLRTLLNTPLVRLTIDPAGRLKIVGDSYRLQSGAYPTSGTFLDVWAIPPIDLREEYKQRSNIEYNECQRSKMTFA